MTPLLQKLKFVIKGLQALWEKLNDSLFGVVYNLDLPLVCANLVKVLLNRFKGFLNALKV